MKFSTLIFAIIPLAAAMKKLERPPLSGYYPPWENLIVFREEISHNETADPRFMLKADYDPDTQPLTRHDPKWNENATMLGIPTWFLDGDVEVGNACFENGRPLRTQKVPRCCLAMYHVNWGLSDWTDDTVCIENPRPPTRSLLARLSHPSHWS